MSDECKRDAMQHRWLEVTSTISLVHLLRPDDLRLHGSLEVDEDGRHVLVRVVGDAGGRDGLDELGGREPKDLEIRDWVRDPGTIWKTIIEQK